MDEKAEDLIKMVEKVSRGIKESEVKAYLGCQKYYKDRVAEFERVKTESKKRFSHHSTLELKQTSSTRIQQQPIRTTGLQEFEIEEDRKEKPIPKGLPLLSRKTRRCLDCKKLLTKSFKTFRNQHKVELGHSEPKVLMCQKTMPNGQKISMKSLIPMVYTVKGQEPRNLKPNEIVEVKTSQLPLNFQIAVEFQIPNRDKKQINYDMVLRWKC